ncbi:hypothetical protein IC582_023428 [Cucumis melo]
MEKIGQPCNNSEVVDLEDDRKARIDPQLEIVEPVIGMKFSSVEETYQFYVNYATKVGFTVRKQYHKKKKNGIVSRASFCCSKEGFRQVNKRKEFDHYTRPISRTGCEASLACLLGKNGQYRVVSFKGNHNHDLGKMKMKRTMDVDMNISNAQKVHDADSSRTSFRATMGLINKEVDGREGTGFVDKDYINYVPIEKKARIEKGEVEALVQYFEKKQRDNSSIFYALQLNEDNMVASIFWTDTRSVYDYECFGDVICFDTTYRSNELGRPFTPFFGVNHHKQSAMFGAALLYDETIESLKWLFNTFLSVMSKKQPKTILTNQSSTIAKAICDVFPETQHRLCVWHIFRSAAKTLSHVFHGQNQFVQDFSSCLFDYENEDDWLLAWQKMLDKYALTDNKWLTYLFELREKWAIVYGRHAFTADMKSTQCSESMNEVLKKYLRPDYDILQFLQQYDRFLADRRCEEMVADFKMNHTTPILPMDTEMLLHVVDIYTPTVFKLFEKEYMNILSCSTFKIGKFDGVSEYKVLVHGSSCHWLVKYEASTQTVTCSCMKFTSTGILCSHALKVLDRKNVKKLPASYILKRWTRDARASNDQTLNVCEKSTGERYNHLCRKFYQITSLAAEHEKLFEHASQTFVQLLKDLEEMKKNFFCGK